VKLLFNKHSPIVVVVIVVGAVFDVVIDVAEA